MEEQFDPINLARELAECEHFLMITLEETVLQHGVSLPEAYFLSAAKNSPAGGETQRELARRSGVSPAQACHIADSLIKKGLLESQRSSIDRRRLQIVLTATGKSTLEKIVAECSAVVVGDAESQAERLLESLAMRIAHAQSKLVWLRMARPNALNREAA